MSLKHPLSLVMPHSFHYIQQFVELSKFAWLFEKHSGEWFAFSSLLVFWEEIPLSEDV